MLPRWLMGFYVLTLAMAFTASFELTVTETTMDRRNELWMAIAVYLVLSLPITYLLMKLRQQKFAVFKGQELGINSALTQIRQGTGQYWYLGLVLTVGRFGLALALVQHVNVTIEREMIVILSAYSAANILMLQHQWDLCVIGVMAFVGFSVLGTSALRALPIITRQWDVRSDKSVRSVLTGIGLCLFFMGLMLVMLHHIYDENTSQGISPLPVDKAMADLHPLHDPLWTS